MDHHEDDKLPCGHTRDEHREMFPPEIAALFEQASDTDDPIKFLELITKIQELAGGPLGHHDVNFVNELGVDPSESELSQQITLRAAEIFNELAIDEEDEPENLEIVLSATSPMAPLKIKLTRLVRSTGEVKAVYEVETLPGVVGAVDLVMGSIAAVCMGLAEREMQADLAAGIEGLR